MKPFWMGFLILSGIAQAAPSDVVVLEGEQAEKMYNQMRYGTPKPRKVSSGKPTPMSQGDLRCWWKEEGKSGKYRCELKVPKPKK